MVNGCQTDSNNVMMAISPIVETLTTTPTPAAIPAATQICTGISRARKIFSVPVAEFFGPFSGPFLVAFSFNSVVIVRQDSKV